jgi:hypothetical protein
MAIIEIATAFVNIAVKLAFYGTILYLIVFFIQTKIQKRDSIQKTEKNNIVEAAMWSCPADVFGQKLEIGGSDIAGGKRVGYIVGMAFHSIQSNIKLPNPENPRDPAAMRDKRIDYDKEIVFVVMPMTIMAKLPLFTILIKPKVIRVPFTDYRKDPEAPRFHSLPLSGNVMIYASSLIKYGEYFYPNNRDMDEIANTSDLTITQLKYLQSLEHTARINRVALEANPWQQFSKMFMDRTPR